MNTQLLIQLSLNSEVKHQLILKQIILPLKSIGNVASWIFKHIFLDIFYFIYDVKIYKFLYLLKIPLSLACFIESYKLVISDIIHFKYSKTIFVSISLEPIVSSIWVDIKSE